MIQTGVTSYIPTITSQRPELYQKVSLPGEMDPSKTTLRPWLRTGWGRDATKSVDLNR